MNSYLFTFDKHVVGELHHGNAYDQNLVPDDNQDHWTYVAVKAFSNDGVIEAVEFNSTDPGIVVEFGIYKPVTLENCHLQLIQKQLINSTHKGITKVSFPQLSPGQRRL